jgi:hypothetical protein
MSVSCVLKAYGEGEVTEASPPLVLSLEEGIDFLRGFHDEGDRLLER